MAVNFLTMLNAATFASTKLTEANFTLRKEQIICLLESHDLLGFVDGTIAEPSTEHDDYMQWKKSDRLVKAWILGCLSDEMLGTVTSKATARDVWVALEADIGRPTLEEEHCTAEPQGEASIVNMVDKATAKDACIALEADKAQNSKDQMNSTTVVSNPDIYFYNLSMVNVTSFVSIKLTSESNFLQWKAQIRCLLRSQCLLSYIGETDESENEDDSENTDESVNEADCTDHNENEAERTNESGNTDQIEIKAECTDHSETDAEHTGQNENEVERLWCQRTENFVKGWIMGSLSEEILKKVANKTTARDVWVALNEWGFIPEYARVPNAELVSHLSSVNMINFVSIKLASRSNFWLWKKQMERLLESHNLYGFVDRTNQDTEKRDDYWRWSTIDTFVRGWILCSVSEDIFNEVSSEFTARDVWEAVERKIFPEVVEDEHEDYSRYLPLYKASQCGDWEKAEEFLHSYPEACRAPLNIFKQTTLHIAVGVTSDKGKHFVEKLVGILTNHDLAMKDSGGLTPLHYAAKFGNLCAAKILVSRDSNLPHVASRRTYGVFPIHNAAEYGNISTDVYKYFWSVTTASDCYTDYSSSWIFNRLIHSSLYDFARELVEKYPHSVQREFVSLHSPFRELARMEFAFLSGSHLNSWQQLLYYCVPIRSTSRGHLERPNANDLERQNANDMENVPNGRWLSSICNRVYFRTVIKKLGSLSFDVLEKLVPPLKRIRDKKTIHHSAVELAECICKKIENLNDKQIDSIVTHALIEATRCGTYELVEMIIKRFPSSVFTFDGDEKSIFHIAIENRCENVFNLVYQISETRHHLMISCDKSGNTMLHSAARLAPQDKLNLIPGAALQMQRELQWFEEVKKLMPSSDVKEPNWKGELAEQLFNEEHRELKEAGEKWMKETATSLTISAALIATIAFAAAITVPGGNNGESGLPIFSRNIAFIVFFISNAASLFTSTTSLLVFLSVFTSRYRPEDFLQSLPRRLIMGLLSLFLSITCMMVSFSATVYLVFGQKKAWMLIPVAIMACFPIASFVFLQFPLLFTLISNTYGGGIFGRKTLDGNYIKGLFSRMTVSIQKTCDNCSPLRVWHFWKENRGRPLP